MAARKRSNRSRTARPARPRPKPTVRPRTKILTEERRRQRPETLRLRAFQPGFTVNDLEQSMRFYQDILGFIVAERWSDAGVLRGVTLKAGLCQLGLSQDDWTKGRDRKKGEGVRIWCGTAQDIDALARRIKAAGGRLTEEPKDQPWGMRRLSIDDPDGYHLTIYQEK